MQVYDSDDDEAMLDLEQDSHTDWFPGARGCTCCKGYKFKCPCIRDGMSQCMHPRCIFVEVLEPAVVAPATSLPLPTPTLTASSMLSALAPEWVPASAVPYVAESSSDSAVMLSVKQEAEIEADGEAKDMEASESKEQACDPQMWVGGSQQ